MRHFGVFAAASSPAFARLSLQEFDVPFPHPSLFVVLLPLSMMASVSAAAQQGQDDARSQGQETLPADWERERQVSLSDSVRRVERDRGGQVLGVERVQSDGRDLNRVKWVDDRGRVRLYMDDPQSAAAASRHRDGPPVRGGDG